MSEQLHIQIAKILTNAKGSPLTREKIYQKLQKNYWYKHNIRTIDRALTHLEKLRVATRVIHGVTTAWVHVEFKVLGEIQLKLRSKHTDLLQDEIIRPLLEQLPEISKDGIYRRNGTVLSPVLKDRHESLPIEKNILFSDFEYHADKLQLKPCELLAEYKKEAEKYWKNIDAFYDSLKLLVEEELYSAKIFPKTLMKKGTKLSFLNPGRPWRDNMFSSQFLDWLYNIVWTLANGKIKDFKKIYNNFYSEVKTLENSFAFFIERYCCIQFQKVDCSEEYFKDRVDKKIRKLLKIFIEPGDIKMIDEPAFDKEIKKSSYIIDMITIIDIAKKLQELKKKIQYSLKICLKLEFLPGYCMQITNLLKDVIYIEDKE